MSMIRAKDLRRMLMVSAVTVFTLGHAAYADGLGGGLKETINEEENLNQFRALMARTGAADTLPSGTYTVFAPVDSAFAEIDKQKYPCFATTTCTRQEAELLRRHIVPGEINLGDAARGKGGVYAVDKERHISVGEPKKGQYVVEGHKVLSAHLTSGGMLYVIDGVIATDLELSEFRTIPVPVVQSVTKETTVHDVEHGIPNKTVTTTTTTIKQEVR